MPRALHVGCRMSAVGPNRYIFFVLTLSPDPSHAAVFRSAVLILIPTRELALQTSAIVKEVGKHMGLHCMVTTGGTSLKDDIMRLYNTVHIIVATPGRILDLASKKVADLSKCRTIIMDEADTCRRSSSPSSSRSSTSATRLIRSASSPPRSP